METDTAEATKSGRWQRAALVALVILCTLSVVYRVTIHLIALAYFDALIANAQAEIDSLHYDAHGNLIGSSGTKESSYRFKVLTLDEARPGQGRGKHLFFSDTSITDEDLWCLKYVRNIVTLRLARTAVTDAGIAHLRSISTIGFVDIESTCVTNSCLEHLACMEGLQLLVVSKTSVTLENCPVFEKLSSFRGEDCPIEDRGVASLLCSAQDLRSVSLDGTSVTNALHSVISDHLPLMWLKISRTPISGSFFDGLRCTGSLRFLYVDDSQYADPAVARLRERCPYIFVRRVHED